MKTIIIGVGIIVLLLLCLILAIKYAGKKSEEAKENKKIADVYAHILKAEDIDNLFGLDNISFERTVNKLPKGIKNSLKAIAAQRIQDGTLDSVNKIKALDKILGTDLFNCYIAS